MTGNDRQRLRAMFDNAALGIVEVDRDDRFVRVNDSFCEILGYTREEMIGKTVSEITAPEDLGRSEDIARQMQSGELSRHGYEKRYVKKDGTRIWVHVTVSAIRDEWGRVVRRIGTIEDISERKRTEEALSESNLIARNTLAELRAIYETAPVGLCLLDTSMRYISVNQAVARINMRAPSEHIGRQLREVLSPELANRAEPFLRHVLETGESVLNREISGRPIDDPEHVHYWLVSYYPVWEGEHIIGIGGVVQEITEVKKAEDALRRSERMFRELADSMPQIVWAAQPDGTVDYFNRRWHELARAPYETTGDQSWIPVLHPEDREAARAAWDESVRTGQALQLESRFQFPGFAEYRWHLTRALPIRDEAGQITRWFGTCTDIHDQKTTQEKLADQAAALAEADRRKDEFLAMLAHELRNPLAPLLYAAQMLQMTLGDQPAVKKMRDMIDRQVRHMGRLLDDLLDVSRITRGKIQLRRELMNLRAVAEQVIESMRPQAIEHKLMLNFQAAEGPLPVDGDPTRIEQILRNLLNNAIKYTPQGGSIWVVVDSEPAGEGRMEAVIRVRDTGVGIEPQVLPHVFELFTQAKQTLARTQGGLGIGLTMVKSLAELHGGRVEAFSEGADQGSEFIVRLPLVEAAEEAPVAAVAAVGEHAAPQRVLVVDDNEDFAVSLNDLLTAWGLEVRTALDGPSAMETARTWRPDAILLDIGLPGMDGYEVAERIRRESWGANVSIVALTGYGSEQDRQRAMRAGFNAHLTKPVEMEQLMAILNKTAA